MAENEVENVTFSRQLLESNFASRQFPKMHSLLFECYEHNVDTKFEQELFGIYGKYIFRLPFRQLVHIYKSFLDTDFIQNPIAVNLFPQFLMHLRVNDSLMTKDVKEDLLECIEKTCEILSSLDVNYESDEFMSKLLSIALAISAVKHFDSLYANNERSVLSKIYNPFFNEEMLKRKFKEDSTDISVIEGIAKLWLQNATFSGSEEMKEELSLILSKMNNLSFFKTMNLASFSYLLNSDQMLTLCRIITAEIVSSDDVSSIINKLNETFRENRTFHSCFINAVCEVLVENIKSKPVAKIVEKLCADCDLWLQFSDTTPKGPPNDLWLLISSLAGEFSNLKFENRAVADKFEKLVEKLVGCLNEIIPLDCLSSGTQMKCLLLLSALQHLKFRGLKAEEAILTCYLSIFDGRKGIWLFDFMKPRLFINCVLKQSSCEDTNIRKMVEKLMPFIIRRAFHDIRESITEIKEFLNETSSTYIHTLTKLCVMEEINARASRIKKINEVVAVADEFVKSLSDIIEMDGDRNESNIDQTLRNKAFIATIDYLIQFSSSSIDKEKLKQFFEKLLIEVTSNLNSLTNSEQLNMSSGVPIFSLITAICDNRDRFGESLPASFLISIFKAHFPDFSGDCVEEKVKEADAQTLSKQIKSLKPVRGQKRKNDTEEKNEEPVTKKSKITNQPLMPKECLKAMFKCSTIDEFREMSSLLMNGMNCVNIDINKIINAWKAMFSFKWGSSTAESEKVDWLKSNLINVLLLLLVNVFDTCNSEVRNETRLQILELFRLILHNSRKYLTSQKVYLAFHCCITAFSKLKVESNDGYAESFVPLYNAVYELLNESILSHGITAISSLSVVNAITSELFVHLMDVCTQELFLKYTLDLKNSLETCALNLDRLVSSLCSLKKDYVPHAPHIIAVYIKHSQTVTVHNDVKRHILQSVYRLLNVIESSGDIDLIHSRLTQTGRELFADVYKNYQKYYKFKGYV